ncbi:hypothetical protein Tco_0688659 [Tanacetum coccineum]
MDGRSSNNGKSEGKGKAPSSEDLHEQIMCPNEVQSFMRRKIFQRPRMRKGKRLQMLGFNKLAESSSKDTQENIHPGLPVDTIVFSPPDHDVVSEDVNEQMPNCNDGTVIVQERKEVEMTSDAKGKEIAEGSTSNEQENMITGSNSKIVSEPTKESLTTPPPSVPNPHGSPIPLRVYVGVGPDYEINTSNPIVVSEHQMEITIQWGHAFNLAGIGNDRGIGSFSTLCQMLTGNSHTGGFEAASTILVIICEGDGDHGDDNETESQLMSLTHSRIEMIANIDVHASP